MRDTYGGTEQTKSPFRLHCSAFIFFLPGAVTVATVKHETFAAIKFCGFSILNFSREDIFADF